MGKRARSILAALAFTLLASGLVSVIIFSSGSGNQSLFAPEVSSSVSSDQMYLNATSLISSTSGGTTILLPEKLTASLTLTSLMAVFGTISTERRHESRYKKLKDRVVDEVAASPGIHLRELHRYVGCAMGALQYHVRNLEAEGMIFSYKNGNSRHFFISGFSTEEQVLRLASLARNPTVNSILQQSVIHGRITQAELSRTLGIDKSLVSYYVSSLLKAEVMRTIRVFGREKPLVLMEWVEPVLSSIGVY
jgi:DNA-binding Lrp family transcriptional regulator